MSAEHPMLDPPLEVPELCNRSGANALKERLEAYWRERGYEIQFGVIPGGFTAALRGGRFDVRSNMKNGLPPSPSVSERAA